MTTKDYTLIAQAISDALNTWSKENAVSERQAIIDVAMTLSSRLESENPRFDRAKFHEACSK